jgi:hypothetical protein
MNKLMKALDKIITDLDSLSAIEIQTKLKAHEGGLVGGAILNCHTFIRSWCDNEFSKYFVNYNSGLHNEKFELSNIIISFSCKLDDTVLEAANDSNYCFPMAA